MTQPRLAEAFVRLESNLRAVGARWALVGGLAVSARAEPRTTRDIDVAVSVSEESEADRIVRSLQNRGYQVLTMLWQEETDRMATVRLERAGKESGILCDLLFASSGIEEEVVAEADVLEVLPGLSSPVAKTGHLLALKVLALPVDRPQQRPQDFTDIRELLAVADDTELRRAREALELISRRGFDRGEDLIARFEDQLDQFRDGR